VRPCSKVTDETRAKFGADATGVVLGGGASVGGVHVNFFVHTLVSWVPSLNVVERAVGRSETQCGGATAAARLGDGSDEVAATAAGLGARLGADDSSAAARCSCSHLLVPRDQMGGKTGFSPRTCFLGPRAMGSNT
jgi:hypothetical protein